MDRAVSNPMTDNELARCTCAACRPNTLGRMRMIVCDICGNKRCPHATNHRNACTNSNEPGQVGSSYGIAAGDTDEALDTLVAQLRQRDTQVGIIDDRLESDAADTISRLRLERDHFAARIATIEGELERFKALSASLADAVIVHDSYGVDGSEFNTCMLCQAGGAPDAAFIHDKHCPVLHAERETKDWLVERAEILQASGWLAQMVIDKLGGTNDLPAWVKRSAKYYYDVIAALDELVACNGAHPDDPGTRERSMANARQLIKGKRGE